ncbi:hypothetical protein [Streptomyces sp. NPDC046832]
MHCPKLSIEARCPLFIRVRGLNAHWTLDTMAEEFGRLREAAGS